LLLIETASEGGESGRRRAAKWVEKHRDLRTHTPVSFGIDPYEKNTISESPVYMSHLSVLGYGSVAPGTHH